MGDRLTFPDWWEHYHKYDTPQSVILKNLWDFKEDELLQLEKRNRRLGKKVKLLEIFIKKGK